MREKSCRQYETEIEITDEQWAKLNICPNEFHGEWNYKILPSCQNSHVIS
jgi:hypothetical protein